MSPASALVASSSDQSTGQHQARMRTNEALKRKGGENRQKAREVEMLEKEPPLRTFFFQKELSAPLTISAYVPPKLHLQKPP